MQFFLEDCCKFFITKNMKNRIALIAAVLTLQAVPSFALVGGPWDNDNFNPLNTGTYQAAIYMNNGIGMARFSDSTAAQFSRLNQSIIYYRGIVYTGTCFGMVDHTKNSVIGITNGDTANTVLAEGVNGLGPGAPFNPLTGTVDSGAGGNVQTCNTSWKCRIIEDAPVLRFEGDGHAAFFGDLSTIETITDISTTTEVGDTETTVDTTITDFGGQSDEFPEAGAQTKIWVHGSQISL
jgi:hypothetical protein